MSEKSSNNKNKIENKEAKITKKEKLLILDAFNFKDTAIKAEVHSTWQNFKIKNTLKNLFLITIGSLLTSLSFYYFINHANLYTNGLSAFAQLIAKAIFLKYEYSDPAYYDQMRALYFYPLFFLMNIPIIIWGVFKVGFRFAIYTTIYMGLNIGMLVLLSLTPGLNDFKVFHTVINSNNILAISFIFAIVGGLIYGVGLGILFKTGGSSGGMDFISTYISMKRKYSIANIIKNTNIIIVVIAVFIDGVLLHHKNVADNYFGDPYFLATIVYIYIGSFVMNRVYPKYMMITVFIISKEIENIRNIIYSNNYLRGGNIWSVKGLYSGNDNNMMMTTMSLLEYNFFKLKIQEIDPKLFMIAVPTRYMHGGVAGQYPKTPQIDIEKINEFLDKKDSASK